MNAKTVAVLSALLCARSAVAAPVRLEDLETRAVHDRPLLTASRARVRAAAAGIERAESAGRPTIALSAEGSVAPGGQLVTVEDLTSHDRFEVQGARAFGDPGAFTPVPRYGLTLGVQSNLYDFGRSRDAAIAARALRGAARAEERVTRAEIIRGVRTAYMGWIAAHELHSVAQQTATDAQSRRTRVQSLIQEGARPPSDLAPARADEALARLEAARAHGDLVRARLVLEQAVGAPLADDASPDPGILTRDVWGQDTADPAMTVLERQREAARASARVHDHRRNPVIAAAAQTGLRGQDGSLFPAYGATLTFSLPLWDGGAGAAGAEEARAQATELRARQAELRRTRQSEQAIARADQASAQERISIAQELLEAAQTRLRQAEERYDIGGGGGIDAIAEARASLRRAQSELVLARVSRTEAILRVAGTE